MTAIITRHRHDTRRRTLTVQNVSDVTRRMRRITLKGDLEGFVSLSFDDHVKLFFETGAEKPEMRDYTPRSFDTHAGTLVLDFVLHEAGPATQWAFDARVGDKLQVGGPRGSAVVAPVFDWYLLIGDETALPAIGRCIEELRAGVKVVSLVAITDSAEQQRFETPAAHDAHWLYRAADAAHEPAPMLKALQALTWPEGKGFVWVASEATVARVLRAHVLQDRNHPKEWSKASGYWAKGKAEGQVKIGDDA